MITLRWMPDDGGVALIEHEDGQLFRYEFGRPGVPVTATYTVADDSAEEVAQRCGWKRHHKAFAGMPQLQEFRDRQTAGLRGLR